MNRGEILCRGLDLTGVNQSELSRLTGVPQSKISRYVTHRLEPSERMLNLLLSSLGLQVSFEVCPVTIERTKLRSWMLHREISRKLTKITESDWEQMGRNLERVRSGVQGQPHERNTDRWQQIIDNHDLRELRHVLVDTSADGIEMREVSPMAGFLTNDERLKILEGVHR